jgi:hypothetical protein
MRCDGFDVFFCGHPDRRSGELLVPKSGQLWSRETEACFRASEQFDRKNE